ncbi:MAG: HAMP domain-containing sensor histidine kinase, partial [Myxococcota bacterium]
STPPHDTAPPTYPSPILAEEDGIYMISHDLIAPVRRIGMLLEVIAETQLKHMDADGEALMQQATREVNKGIARMKAFMELLRLEHRELTLEPVDLEMVLRSVMSTHPASAYGTIEGQWKPVQGDMLALKEVAVELLTNAVRFAQPDVPLVIAITGEIIDGAQIWRIEDNGQGFKPEHEARAFVPFKQFHSPGTYPGLGVGLTISQRLVARCGGSIRLHSQPNQGTTAVVTLPLA